MRTLPLLLACACSGGPGASLDAGVDAGAAHDAAPADGATDAGPAPYQWPAIDEVDPPGCTLAAYLQKQPAHAGPPSTLPDITALPGMVALRECFADTARAQAWSLFAATAELEPTHRFVPGGVHFFAHENNVEGFSTAVLQRYVEYLQAAGVQLVGIHMGTFPWLCTADSQSGCAGSDATKGKYDAIMTELAAHGMTARLMLPITDSTRFPMSSWVEYRDNMLQVVTALFDRYGGTALAQVGMHEPSSVEHLIVQKLDPDAELDPLRWRDELVDPVCALAHAGGARCSATLIPAPESSVDSERRFVDAAITSQADLLGVNNIHYYDLEPAVIDATTEFIGRFAEGTLLGGGQGTARGRGSVFLNAAWRPAWPMTPAEPVASNAAGLGCAELDGVDDSYLGALFAYARAQRLASLTVYYTTSFIAKRTCTKDIRMYASVENPYNPAAMWLDYQQGSAIADGEYRVALMTRLSQPGVALTTTGMAHAALAALAAGDP